MAKIVTVTTYGPEGGGDSFSVHLNVEQVVWVSELIHPDPDSEARYIVRTNNSRVSLRVGREAARQILSAMGHDLDSTRD